MNPSTSRLREKRLHRRDRHHRIVLGAQVHHPVVLQPLLLQPVDEVDEGLYLAGVVGAELEGAGRHQVDARQIRDRPPVELETDRIVLDDDQAVPAPPAQRPHQPVDLLRIAVGLDEVADGVGHGGLVEASWWKSASYSSITRSMRVRSRTSRIRSSPRSHSGEPKDSRARSMAARIDSRVGSQ